MSEKIDNEFNVLIFTYDANAYPNIYADSINLVAWYKFDDDTNIDWIVVVVII